MRLPKLSYVFWTNPTAMKLLNAFSIVFLMDSTCKTNKYRLPLLEIVGVTSTKLTFSAAFVFFFVFFIKYEKELRLGSRKI